MELKFEDEEGIHHKGQYRRVVVQIPHIPEFADFLKSVETLKSRFRGRVSISLSGDPDSPRILLDGENANWDQRYGH